MREHPAERLYADARAACEAVARRHVPSDDLAGQLDPRCKECDRPVPCPTRQDIAEVIGR